MDRSEGSSRNSEVNGQPTEITGKSWIQKFKSKCLRGVKISLLISLIFYIAMFGIGVWGVNKCPAEDNIPFFLIVTGGIGLISKTISIIREVLLKIEEKTQYVESFFYTVEFVFLLLGSFWVFKVYKPTFDPAKDGYCNKTVYMFAFIYLAVLYSIIAAVVFGFLCFLGCICFVKQTESEVDPEAQSRPIHQP